MEIDTQNALIKLVAICFIFAAGWCAGLGTLGAQSRASLSVVEKASRYDKVKNVVQEKALPSELSAREYEVVDVYVAPCGEGYQVRVSSAGEEASIGFGCEAVDRTYTRKFQILKSTSTDEILVR